MATNVTNTSNVTNTPKENHGCYNMTKEDFRTATAITIGFSFFTCLICAIAIFLIIFLKAYSNRSARLVFYLNLTVFCFMFAEAMQILPLKIEDNALVIGHEGLCTAAAFLDQFFASLVVLTQCSMALYLLFLINSKNKVISHSQAQNKKNRAREICGVIMAVSIAIVLATIPLIPFVDETMYGVYGVNCWIKQKDDNCEQLVVGMVEAILLSYLPFAIAFVFMDITLVLAVRALCKRPAAKNLTPSERVTYEEAHKEARALTFYLSIFAILYFINTTLFLLYHNNAPQQDDDILWHAGSAVHSLLWLSVPAAYIFHPATLKKLRCSEVKQAANRWRGIHDDEVYTSFHVSSDSEFPECNEQLVIRGSDRHKRDAGYHTMLERPI